MSAALPSQTETARRWCLGGLAALLVAQVLLPADAVTPAAGVGLPQVLFWLVFGALAIVTVARHGSHRIRFEATDAAFLALVAWHTLSGLRATFHGAARPAINVTWEWIGMACAYLLVRQLITSRRESRALMAVMIGLAVALSAQALYQVIYELPETRRVYESDPELTLRTAMDLEPNSRIAPLARRQFEARLDSPEPTATFALTNSFAGFLLPWLVLTIAIASNAWQGIRTTHRNGWIAAGCATILGIALILTYSRSAFVALFLCLGVFAWYHRPLSRFAIKARVGIVTLIVGVIAMGLWLAAPTTSPLWQGAVRSFRIRWEYWQATGAMIGEHLLWGCGPGNFGDTYTAYQLPSAYETVGDPHNFLLEVGATAGAPAFLLLIITLACFLRRACGFHATVTEDEDASLQPEEAPGSDRSILGGAVAGLVLALLCSQIYPSLIVTSTTAVSLAAIGLVAMATIGLLLPWIAHGSITSATVGLAVVTLLVHLLASGGIGNHGVAGSLWLLMGLGLNLATPAKPPRTCSPMATRAALLATLGLAVTCFITAYQPVLTSRTAIVASRTLEAHGEHLLADAKRREAVAADPINVEAHAAQVQKVYQEGLALFNAKADSSKDDRNAWRDRFLLATETWHDTAPQSSDLIRHFSRMMMQLYRLSGDDRFLHDAANAYRLAIERYPNSAPLHANLAWTYHLNRQPDEAARSATTALRLDDQMLETDYQLDSEFQTLSDPNAPNTDLRSLMENLAAP